MVLALSSGASEGEMDDFIAKALAERRSLEKALKDLRAKYERQPNPDLAEMIRQLEVEISQRGFARNTKKRARSDNDTGSVKGKGS
jgi:phage shock protein A